MPGIDISYFNDFMDNTGPALLTNAQDVLNEATRNTYIYGRMMKGAGIARTLKGGKTIRDVIMFDEKSTRQHVQRGQEFNWQNPQVTQYHEVPWKFTLDHLAWDAAEIDLNDNTEYMTDAGWFHMFKEVKRIKWERLWTSWYNGCEDDLWATPSLGQMESSGGKTPYCIPALVNEEANGLYNTAITGNWTTGGTKQGMSVTLNPKWDNVRQTMAQLPTTPALGADWDGFQALSKAVHQSGFAPLPGKGEQYSESVSHPQFIATQLDGVTNMEIALRRHNDRLLTPQDANYGNPRFAGIDVVWVATLDTALLYPDASAGGLGTYNGATTVKTGPRYYGINPLYLFPVLHAKYYAKVGNVREHPNQVDTFVQIVQQWHNLYARSLRRQFIVAPSATLS